MVDSGKRPALTQAQLKIRQKVRTFFERLKADLGLSGLTREIFDELISEINRIKGGKQYPASALRALQQRNSSASQDLFERIVDAIPKVGIWRQNRKVHDLYREVFGIDFEDLSLDRAVFNFQRTDREPLGGDSLLLGDYLLYRSEVVESKLGKTAIERISRSFFRFYIHRNSHVRSMGLWLDDKHEFLSTKGWVVNPDNHFLVVGHIVDRVGDTLKDIRRGGGATMMTIRETNPNRFTIVNKENSVPRIQLAPALHFRATNSTEPSFSRGVLVRLRGVEALGGGPEASKEQRYIQIKELQKMLSERLSKPITIREAAKQLSRASEWDPEVFYKKDGSDGLPDGLLVNKPSYRTSHGAAANDGPEYMFGSAEHLLPDGIKRSLTKRPVGQAGIHFDELKK
ncbi:MAG TPA: hypothetical protein V6D19_02820 [Stenomitos sp.]